MTKEDFVYLTDLCLLLGFGKSSTTSIKRRLDAKDISWIEVNNRKAIKLIDLPLFLEGEIIVDKTKAEALLSEADALISERVLLSAYKAQNDEPDPEPVTPATALGDNVKVWLSSNALAKETGTTTAIVKRLIDDGVIEAVYNGASYSIPPSEKAKVEAFLKDFYSDDDWVMLTNLFPDLKGISKTALKIVEKFNLEVRLMYNSKSGHPAYHIHKDSIPVLKERLREAYPPKGWVKLQSLVDKGSSDSVKSYLDYEGYEVRNYVSPDSNYVVTRYTSPEGAKAWLERYSELPDGYASITRFENENNVSRDAIRTRLKSRHSKLIKRALVPPFITNRLTVAPLDLMLELLEEVKASQAKPAPVKADKVSATPAEPAPAKPAPAEPIRSEPTPAKPAPAKPVVSEVKRVPAPPVTRPAQRSVPVKSAPLVIEIPDSWICSECEKMGGSRCYSCSKSAHKTDLGHFRKCITCNTPLKWVLNERWDHFKVRIYCVGCLLTA